MEPKASSRRTLVIAAVAILVITRWVPFGGLLLYPFTLLATWVHEMGHGLTALLTGGHFYRLDIFADASGLASFSSTGATASGLTALGGLLAPPLAGAAILATARGPRRARLVLGVVAAALLASLVIWVRSSTGMVTVPLLAAVLGLCAWKGGDTLRRYLAQGIGLLLALDTVSRFDYVFMSAATIDGVKRPSDIAQAAQALGGPQMMWSLLVAGLSIALCLAGVVAAWRRPATA